MGKGRGPEKGEALTDCQSKPNIQVIEDAHGNSITMSNGKISIKSSGIIEIKAAMITLNGRVVAPNDSPI